MFTQSAQRVITGLSRNAEFVLVILAVFGGSLYRNIHSLLVLSTEPPFTLNRFLFLIVFESAALFLVGWFLLQRGYTSQRLGLHWAARDLVDGFKLFGMVIGLAFLFVVTVHLLGGSFRDELVGGNIDMLIILIISLLNPVFEEIFECGYIITFFNDIKMPWVGVAVGAALRAGCHLYKGFWGALNVFLFGLLFGAWYVRHRRLWPVIVVHALMDFIGLASLSRLAAK